MSFSQNVKQEIMRNIPEARHCRIAFLSGITMMIGNISYDEDGNAAVSYHSENEDVIRICFTLLRKTIRISADIQIRRGKTFIYRLLVRGRDAGLLLLSLKMEGGEKRMSRLIYERSCCRRNLIRGVFLSGGSVSDPERSYHMEIVCDSRETAEDLKEIIGSFDVESRIHERKRNFVLYLKEGDDIVTMLNVMEAPGALMDMENARIYKDMRNTVNRRVNCETANIAKTVSAAVRQVNDIEYIREKRGFGFLDDALREMAEVRLKYPEAALKELGNYLDPPVGKSGVNHRLRKLCSIADDLRRSINDQEKR